MKKKFRNINLIGLILYQEWKTEIMKIMISYNKLRNKSTNMPKS